METRNLRIREIQIGAHAGIVRHTKKPPTAAESAVPVLPHHAAAFKTFARTFATESELTTPESGFFRSPELGRPSHPGGMLPLPSILATGFFILAPSDHRCSHHHKKYRRDPSNSLSH